MEPIYDVDYWKQRLANSSTLHHAVFKCPDERWQRIAAKHRGILATYIKPGQSILDAGCAWGRLLDLLPDTWDGRYLGVDLSPDFIKLAIERYAADERMPGFAVYDLRHISSISSYVGSISKDYIFDWAILISIRPMILRHYPDTWPDIEAQLKQVSRRRLYLEYDEDDPGSIEVGNV